MVEVTLNKLDKQVIVFIGLSVVNIVFAAIALAFGIVFIISNLSNLFETGIISNLSILYVIAGGCLAIIGFYWLLPSASIMDFITDLQIENHKSKEKNEQEKEITFIIRLLSYYRENDLKIKRMIFISKIGGSFFLISGIIKTIDVIISLNQSTPLNLQAMQIAAIVLMFGWGIISLFIPRFLKEIARVWEYRVEISMDAEDILRQHMETL
jgi:hypothetical protein